MSQVADRNPEVRELLQQKYRHGFVTDIESDTLPPGLDEDVIRLISARKGEPEFLLDWRLRAFRYWRQAMELSTCFRINEQNTGQFERTLWGASPHKPTPTCLFLRATP